MGIILGYIIRIGGPLRADLRPVRPNFRQVRADFGPDRADFRSEGADIRLGKVEGIQHKIQPRGPNPSLKAYIPAPSMKSGPKAQITVPRPKSQP